MSARAPRAATAAGLALALAVLTATALAPRDAAAFVREQSNWDPAALPVAYNINLSTAPSTLGAAGARSAVEAGFASWSAPSCTSWQASDQGDTSRGASTRDGLNTILWVSGTWPAELGDVNTTIGVTTPVWTQGGYFFDADIRFNNVGFRWNLTGQQDGRTPDFVDTQSIATHEEGHFLGLDHTSISSAIMYASYSGGTKRTLASDDTAGVCTIYPSGTEPPPDAGGPGPGEIGASCGQNTPCADASQDCLCDSSGACFCSRACGTSNPCPTGSTCTDTSIGPYCIPDGGGGGTGSGATGDPCSSASDCASGICVSDGTNQFCTQACNDDCNCGAGYACYQTQDPSLSVCGPGTNHCGASTGDAGTGPNDAGGSTADAAAGADAQSTGDAGAGDPDAGGASNDAGAAGDAGNGGNQGGCHCSTPGGLSPARAPRALLALGLAALAALAPRRRRRA